VPLALAATKVYKGGAAAIVLGTGFGTPLVPTTVNHAFVGVFTETYDNSGGTAGGYFTKIVRKGLCKFNQSGITAASIKKPAYFSDDNTVSLTEGTTYAGVIAAVDAAGLAWVDIEEAVRSSSLGGKDLVALSGSTDAINPHVEANYVVTTAGVDAMTLAAPTTGTDDGIKIIITSATTNAHTLTATGLLGTGTASVNVATFAARAGSGLTLVAYAGKWNVLSSVGITFS